MHFACLTWFHNQFICDGSQSPDATLNSPNSVNRVKDAKVVQLGITYLSGISYISSSTVQWYTSNLSYGTYLLKILA